MVFTLVLAASCNRKFEYEPMTYATLYHTSYSVDETVGEVRVPVLLNNSNGSEVQVSVKLNAGKAVEGVDYELISPASGILTFSGETDSLDVVIGITSFEGEFTGAKDFSLEISSLTAGVTVANVNTIARFNINDLDHPLSAFVGEWEGTLMFATNPPTPLPAVLSISIDEADETYTKMIIDGWEAHPSYKGYAVPVSAVYDASTSTVNVLAGQMAWNVSGYGFVFYGFDGSNVIDLRLAYDAEAGTLTQMDMYGCYNTVIVVDESDLGWWSLYQSGTVFTKKK